MKALVYTGPGQLVYREIPAPSPREGEVLLRVEAVGVCGSDMHAFLGHDERRPAPLILGHEVAGTIIEGPGAGRRVTVNPLVTCGRCEACQSGRNNICPERQIISMPPREGAFAELLAMPLDNLIDVPDHIGSDKAALCEPLACGWHAVRIAGQALAKPIEDAKCLVLGGGSVGLGAALVLMMRGAREVCLGETNPKRRATVAAAGDFRVFDPLEGSGLDDGTADLVIDAVGFSATREASCRAVRPGGVIMHIGLGDAEGGLDVRRMTLQEITFIGTYTYDAADFRDTAQAIFEGRFGDLDWAESRALADGMSAFSDIRNNRTAAPKIILKP